jgi:polar amino acid transport system substrate-binding protein
MKKNVLKTIKLMSLLVLTSAIFVGCSNKDNAQTPAPAENNNAQAKEETETLIMGLDDTFAPMGFRDEKGELVGFDIDLANEVSERIKTKIEFQPIDWSMKETELNQGNIDFIWNGYTVTEERKEKVSFTKPYLENSQIIVTMADSAVNTKADLKDKMIAVQAESSALDAINAEPDFVASVKELVEFSTNNEAFNDLEAGRSDALVVDEVLARYYMKQKGQEKYKVLEENFGDEEYAVGLRKDDTELLAKVDAALEEMKSDGTYEEIYSKWFSEN